MADGILVPMTIGAATGAGLSLATDPRRKPDGDDKKAIVSGALILGAGLLALKRPMLSGACFMAAGLWAIRRSSDNPKGNGRNRAQLAAGAMSTILGGSMVFSGPDIAQGIARFAIGAGTTSIVAGTLDALERRTLT